MSAANAAKLIKAIQKSKIDERIEQM